MVDNVKDINQEREKKRVFDQLKSLVTTPPGDLTDDQRQELIRRRNELQMKNREKL